MLPVQATLWIAVVLLLAVLAGNIQGNQALQIFTLMALWIAGSVPLGVVVGHCALSED